MKLSKLVLEDYAKYKEEAAKLQQELRDTYNRDDIFVTMGQYYERDRGFGKVSYTVNDEIDPAEWKNMLNYLKAKGFEITQESNWYDEDDDRRWYPDIKFEFDV